MKNANNAQSIFHVAPESLDLPFATLGAQLNDHIYRSDLKTSHLYRYIQTEERSSQSNDATKWLRRERPSALAHFRPICKARSWLGRSARGNT